MKKKKKQGENISDLINKNKDAYDTINRLHEEREVLFKSNKSLGETISNLKGFEDKYRQSESQLTDMTGQVTNIQQQLKKYKI